MIRGAVEGVAALSLAAALAPARSAAYLQAFASAERDALTMLAIQSHTAGFSIALVFFGVECVVLGHLIRRSGYVPAGIGVLMQLAGLCYVVNSGA